MSEQAVNETRNEAKEICKDAGRWRDRLRRLGVPKLYQEARIDDFAESNARGEMRNAAWLFHPDLRSRPRDVLILGDNGTGKTRLAAALAGLWRARWCSAHELIQRVRRSFKSNVEESERSIIEDLVAPRALVLDDVTAGSRGDFGSATLLALVSKRIDEERRTIVTSHQDLATIDRLDSSLASRLAGFERMVIAGKDRRARGP